MILLQAAPDGEISDFLVKFLFESAVIDSAVEKIIKIVTVVALAIGAVMYFSTLAYNYATTSLRSLKDKSVEFFVDYEDLARTLVIMGCIVIYLPIAQGLMGTIDFINNFSAPTINQQIQMGKHAQDYLGQMDVFYDDLQANALKHAINDPKTGSEQKEKARKELSILEDKNGVKTKLSEDKTNTGEKKPTVDGAQDSQQLSSLVNMLDPGKWIPMAINGLVLLLTSIIRIVIASVTVNVLKVLLCVGPLAFAFSILPAFKNQITIWFGTVLNVGFVFTTMNILDHLVYANMEFMVKKNTFTGPGEITATMAFNATIVIMYTMCFWLTSKYVGKGDGGRVLSKMVGVASAAAGAGLMMSGGGAGAGGNVGNAASAGKNIIDPN